MVIAKWHGELDEEQFQRTLRSPQEVERATDQALDTTIEPTQRFRRTETPADSREPAPASSS